MGAYVNIFNNYDNIILLIVGILIGYFFKSFSLKQIDNSLQNQSFNAVISKIVKLSTTEKHYNTNNHNQQQHKQSVGVLSNGCSNNTDHHLKSINLITTPPSSSSKLITNVPKHVAVIMDGNRRYGKKVYGDALKGHWSGGQTLVDFIQWCMAEGVGTLTVYAFSTENWQRPAAEIDTLMAIFAKYIDTLLKEAVDKNVRVKILSTDRKRLPLDTQRGMTQLEECTRHCTGFILNVAVSYGGRAELVEACVSVASDIAEGKLAGVHDINEQVFASHLSTAGCSDPDLLIRTSGESRLSNFMPWQLAYTELVFVDKLWPELTRDDLRTVLHMYSQRTRRFGV